jgi:DNA-binding HxlR family transcriptional regulator
VEDVALNKWSMPILLMICCGYVRFSELKESLPGLTPRSLTRALKDLQAAGLIERLIHETHPPSVSYLSSARGNQMCPVLTEIAEMVWKTSEDLVN